MKTFVSKFVLGMPPKSANDSELVALYSHHVMPPIPPYFIPTSSENDLMKQFYMFPCFFMKIGECEIINFVKSDLEII